MSNVDKDSDQNNMWKAVKTTSLMLLAIYFLLCIRNVNGWFFSHDTGRKAENLRTESAPDQQAPFEMQTTDQEFLLQAKFAGELSPLELCHHMVIQFYSTCINSTNKLNSIACSFNEVVDVEHEYIMSETYVRLCKHWS